MNKGKELPVYYGQVEKSVDGSLWAVVYQGDPARSGSLVRQERVRVHQTRETTCGRDDHGAKRPGDG